MPDMDKKAMQRHITPARKKHQLPSSMGYLFMATGVSTSILEIDTCQVWHMTLTAKLLLQTLLSAAE
jgi:hypothetical protein